MFSANLTMLTKSLEAENLFPSLSRVNVPLISRKKNPEGNG